MPFSDFGPASVVEQLARSLQLSADGLTILLVLLGACVALVRRLPAFRRYQLRTPIRRALRRLDRPERQALVRWSGGSRRRLVGALGNRVLAVAEGTGETPATALAALLADLHSAGSTSEAHDGRGPPWTATAAPFTSLLAAARLPDATSLISRIIYPEEAREVASVISRLYRHVSRVSSCVPVHPDRQQAVAWGATGFSSFVTSLTGAPILVDASSTKSGCADQVLLWHEQRFLGAWREGQELHFGTRPSIRYRDLHGSTAGCAAREPADRPPGDFDQRVLRLRSASLCESITAGVTTMVLETAETCYAVTELGGECIGCKHVVPSRVADQHAPVVTISDDQVTTLAGEESLTRTVLLTSYVSLITADGQLALARRTGHVSHGANVLSATAGGVIEPQDPPMPRDIDDYGIPDPLSAVLREAQEEIGYVPERQSWRPVAVFQANIRGRSDEHRDDGQLVAVVLYLAHTELSMEELQRSAATFADPARGKFEQRGVIGCPLRGARKTANWAARYAVELDQYAMLSVVYACAFVHGVEETQRRFARAFPRVPWWNRSPYADGAARLVRDPRHLVPAAKLEESGPAAWTRSWGDFRL